MGRRADGFHELETVFQTLTLADEITLELAPGRGVEMICAPPRGPRRAWLAAPADGSNLAARAAELAAAEFGIRGRIRVQLRKRIPIGAGLGGGSADAAAVLRLLAAAVRPAPPASVVVRLAAELGADVPALLLGGAVLGLGRGDECFPLPDPPSWWCVLVLARRPVATAAAFALWDQRHPGATGRSRCAGGLRRGERLTAAAASAKINSFLGSLRSSLPRTIPASSAASEDRNRRRRLRVQAGVDNDFFEVVSSLSPDFAEIQRALARVGAAWVSLSGSGAAQFGLFPDRRAALAAARGLGAAFPTWVARFAPRRV